jgi:hypothetical protein
MLFAYDAAYGMEELYTIAAAQTTAAVVFGTGVSGDNKWSGTGLVTEWSLSSPNTNENVTGSFTIQGTGELTMSS